MLIKPRRVYTMFYPTCDYVTVACFIMNITGHSSLAVCLGVITWRVGTNVLNGSVCENLVIDSRRKLFLFSAQVEHIKLKIAQYSLSSLNILHHYLHNYLFIYRDFEVFVFYVHLCK